MAKAEEGAPIGHGAKAVAVIVLWAIGVVVAYGGFLELAYQLWPAGFSLPDHSDSGPDSYGVLLGATAILVGSLIVGGAIAGARRSRWPTAVGTIGLVAQVATALTVITSSTDGRTCSFDAYRESSHCVSLPHAVSRDLALYLVPAGAALLARAWPSRTRRLSAASMAG